MLNHETNLSVDLMVGSPPNTGACPHAYVECVRQASDLAFEFFQKQLKKSAVRQKTLYDQTVERLSLKLAPQCGGTTVKPVYNDHLIGYFSALAT